MDQQRGRSPSAGHQQSHISQTHSPSPQQFQDSTGSVGLGLALDPSSTSYDQQFLNGTFTSNSGIPSFDNNEFLTQQNPSFSQGGLEDSNYVPDQAFTPKFKSEDQSSHYGQPPQRSFTQELLNAGISSSFNDGDFSLYSTPSGQGEPFEQPFLLNEQTSNANVNPSSEINMSSPPAHTPTPPGLLQPDSRSPSSAHQSPSFNQGQFHGSPSHSRNASLGPESAAFPQGPNQVEWGMMPPQFTTHRRTPSEYSDVSASSANHSPNLGHHDTFESMEQHHSPMQHPQDSSLYQEVLGIGSFSLSDTQHSASPGRGLSPAHSPAISPRLGPQQLPNVNQQNSFMLGMNNGFGPPQHMYGAQGQESFPRIHQHGAGSVDMGQAQQMVPPEINVEFAPTSRQNSFEPPKPSFDQDALTPPDRGRRRRAVSDPYNSASSISHPHTQSSLSPGVGSDLSAGSPDSHRSLSPNDRTGASSPSSRRRQSTSSLPNRDYILGLADPEYQAATAESGNAKRVQKHPATFQCTLCPKRFTRAYNLRSHLRTHTDERPFVCTVCGKAFARQHDRKRHEGLHSGEKKFVCKGELKQGGQWGCGRRFARADALGRHFRSEAGRICIKPLLDEEAIERQRLWQEQRMQHNLHSQQIPENYPMDASGNYTLPAALLAQYPALATLSWGEIPQGDAGIDDESRSSFDASGSEFYDEDQDGYVSSGPGPQQGYGQGQGQMNEGYGGYSSDVGAR